MKICPVCVIMYYRVIFLRIEYYFEKKSILKISHNDENLKINFMRDKKKNLRVKRYQL